MHFIETTHFTKAICSLLSDSEYQAFQEWIMANPMVGDVIAGTGGLRKVRWKSAGSGKRGGIRIVYYWLISKQEIRLLLAYGKSEQASLTSSQKVVLKQIIERWQ